MDFYLVSHTHWDREWYRTTDEFRQRLVDLVDELIADPPGDGEAFLLDGQAIVVEDYLAVKPENRERLRGLLQAGRLEAGPWYVLADELIPSGEALVRNLLVGHHVLQDSIGTVGSTVLYCPDSFGHPAALPELAAGFDLPLIVLWRGYGGQRAKPGDVVRWQAPSGVERLIFHLPPDGYEFGSSLPADPKAAEGRWAKMRAVLSKRATLGVSLVQNGADHHARQSNRNEAVAALRDAVSRTGDRLHVSSLGGFADAILERASLRTLTSVVRGELRDSYGYTWTLQGTFGTRAPEKRMNAIAERTLRRAEAWCAAARLGGGRSRIDHLRAGWKTLLQAHPHDTLCGTSIDAVADAMELRLQSARRQGVALVRSGIEALLAHDAASARNSGAPTRDRTVIANGAPYARGGVAIVEMVEKIADEPVGPGSGKGPRLDAIPARDKWTPPRGAQLLSSRIARHRVESTRHYPDNDIVRSRLVACVVEPQPGMSARVVEASAFGGEIAPVSSTGLSLRSGETRVKLDRRGSMSFEGDGLSIDSLVRFEDRADAGDLYTPSIRDTAATARLVSQELAHRGPLIGELSQEWTLAPARKARPSSSVTVNMRLTAGSPLVEFRIAGVNRLKNHRLRIGIATGLAGASVHADAAFGPVERKRITVSPADEAMETPPRTDPLHRYVALFTKTVGVTVHSDGLAEYEVDDEGVVWITLVRAVGQLSRNDLPERPGHAGWPEATPGAQCLGRFSARFALQVHGPISAATWQAIEQESDRFLHPLRGFTLRSTVTDVQLAGGIELTGTALAASAIKEAEDARGVVLRCVNLSDREQPGAWRIRGPIDSAHHAALDEQPRSRLDTVKEAEWTVIPFKCPPRGVMTILVKCVIPSETRDLLSR